ncbi:MAG: glycine oxidase ThiO [Pyrinomonadaceae bacterium]
MKREVSIIGGGVIGLSIARELCKKGFNKITIIEKGIIGKESSYAAAGMLAVQAETNQPDAFFEFCNESNKLYPNFSQELFNETGVDIELDREGTLYLAFNERDEKELRARYGWQKKAGLTVEKLSAVETHKLEPFVSPEIRGSLYFPNDWQVENRKLIQALEKYAEFKNIEIRENTEIKTLLIENGKIIGAETDTEKFHAEIVVLTTGAWTSLIKGAKFALPEVKPIRGQIIEFQTAKRLFQKVIYSPRGYLVPRADGRILVGATVEDTGFDKTISDAAADFLRENAQEIAPNLINLVIHDQRVGLRPFAADGLPILGQIENVENLFIATAHYRNGILLAPMTAKFLAEKIADNKDSEYLDKFSSRRFQNTAEARA